jgi:transglutaminase-like putative cysteine protease
MRIRAGFQIRYDCPAPTPMILMLNVRPERRADLITDDALNVSPAVPIHAYRDAFGNICSRVTVPAGRTTFASDFLIQDPGAPDPVDLAAEEHPIEALPDSALVYLLGSRYCETDALLDTAWRLFGDVAPGWARVQAIVDYTHDHVAFGYEHASPTRTALQTHEEARGVCRDYAHLAIAFCRCMNIPARYCTGYLGDIGGPARPTPKDFSAWFEAYLGGAWRAFDPRHNRRRIGRIPMACGRDAVDVAIATTFGPAELVGFEVVTEEV